MEVIHSILTLLAGVYDTPLGEQKPVYGNAVETQQNKHKCNRTHA